MRPHDTSHGAIPIFRLEGPVVGELQKLFMQTWEKQHGKPLAAKNYFPALKAQGNESCAPSAARPTIRTA